MKTPSMRVLVTGSTGLVGRALCLRLARDGHQVVAWVRSPERARALLGAGPELVAADDDASLRTALAACDAVVHLAGENLFAGRWTARRRRALVDSRVALTERLVRAMAACGNPPRTLVAASAVGFYGERGDERLDESSRRGEGFLSELCVRWEAAAREAEALGTRVVSLRIGMVLAAEGGALARLLPLFRLGGGGRLGSGRQHMSWIHLDDLLEMTVTALTDERWFAAVNATAPEPVTNAEFTRSLARALRRPALAPAPGPALRLALGEAAEVLLASQRVVPATAQALGFRFDHPTLDSALAAELAPPDALAIGPAREVPDVPYLRERRPRLLLEQVTHIDAPLEQVFGFFSRAENLGAMTPPSMSFAILTPLPIEMRAGALIDYRIQLGPVPMGWRTRIDAWEPQRRFVDSQLKGPYRGWYHEHAFEAVDGGTRMRDRVWFAAPLGPLGRIAERLVITRQLRAIFGFREKAIRRRFGRSGPRRGGSEGPSAAPRPRQAARSD